ncbi:methyl-accepting chemotaxis protein [Shewanella sp. NFH-SH190041]|uniref:methyl-accepting chemotaxis protein n=1 Tax=Shewanella sp. NFH-SH190041 TaxID=2950245 RepID=UPI0021C401F1|nr:methyl-accepting chemotaxis protein [Shewanella sp. NFH-SH190041]
MKSFSLKQKILFSVIISLLVVTCVLSWHNYRSQIEQLQQSSVERLQNLSKLQAEEISEWLHFNKKVILALSEHMEIGPEDSLQQAQQSGSFLNTYMGYTDGRMQDSDPSINRQGYDPRTRLWYKKALANSDVVVTKPFISAAFHKPIITVAKAIKTGVVAGNLAIDKIIDNIVNMKLPANGFAILVDKDGTVIAYKNHNKIMGPLQDIDEDLATKLVAQHHHHDHLMPIHFSEDDKDKLVWAEDIQDAPWDLILVLDKETLEAPMHQMLISQIVISLIVLLLSVLAIYVQIGRLFSPLAKVSKALRTIANGRGDLTQHIDITANDEIGELAGSFNRFVESQRQLIGQVRALSHEVGEIADLAVTRNHASADELHRQQQDVNMVATAVTELASATQAIAENAEQTATAANQSSVSGEQGKGLVEQTRKSINSLAKEVGQATDVIGELSRHAQAITSVLSTIQGIAEQTNLLALNAAIEAARAGEQGRGFAVVADEVRVLSHRTQESTKEIHETIEMLQRTTADAVELMQASQLLATHSVKDADTAANALTEITTAIDVISDMATQIATAAEQQTQVTADISQNTIAIKDGTDEMSEGAKNGVDHALRLKQKSKDLADQVATFKL